MERRGGRRTGLRAAAVGVAALVATIALLAVDVAATTEPAGPVAAGPTAAPVGAAKSGPTPRPGPGAAASVAGITAQSAPDMTAWPGIVAGAIDDTTLEAAGVTVPSGGNVFAARIIDGGPSPAYVFYEAGGGAFSDQFYPASSIKLLAALGALELIGSYGFTGEAALDEGYTVHDVYDAAIRYSSNDDYSELVRIAGVEWLNRVFLPEHGFESTAIQEAYGGEDEQVADSPAMDLTEGGREVEVPERSGYDDYGCGGTNCSDLFDMTDAIRRVILDGEVPQAERFDLAPSDVAGLQDSLLGAESWILPGVQDVFGPDAEVYSKPGWVGGLDCVDTALVVDPGTGRRYLIGVTAPDYDYLGCDGLAPLAEEVLSVLSGIDGGVAVRTDGSHVAVVDGRQSSNRP